MFDKYARQNTREGGGTYNRIESALKFTEELFNKNPAYFQRVPDVKNFFERAKKLNHDYLAHEYFNRDWMCMYFSEVAEIMQNAKLNFACTAEIIESLEFFNFQKDILDFLNKFENPIMKEQIKDYFRSRQFRKDLYIRGARQIPHLERMKRLINMNYILMKKDFPKAIKLSGGQINLPENIAEKIREHLSAENYSFKNFVEFAKKNPAIQMNDLTIALMLLIYGGIILPCQSEKNIQRVKNHCVNLNKYICNRAKTNDDVKFLSSPVLGWAYPLGRTERIFLSAVFEGKKYAGELANYAWKIFSENGQRLVRDNKMVESAEENISMFKDMAQNFLNNDLPLLKNLQII